MSRYRDKAIRFRDRQNAHLAATKKMIRIDEIDPEELEEMIDMYPTWEKALEKGKKVLVGKHYSYKGKLYKVNIEHIPQENWNPERDQTLWHSTVPVNVIAAWEQRYGHNPYQVGDQVIWTDGKIYTCKKITTYSPKDVPTDWEVKK